MKSKEIIYVRYPSVETKEHAVISHGVYFYSSAHEYIQLLELSPVNVLFQALDNNTNDKAKNYIKKRKK